jgi:vancomycin resistance protein YoaR
MSILSEKAMNVTLKAIILLTLFLVIEEINPTHYCAGSTEEKIITSSFSTSLAGQDDNVRRNIIIACQKLDGIIISSNSVFSFNDSVGEGSAKNGFSPGRVLYRDRIAMEPGGGLCQVSSTLYNAFLMAGCVIIERHRHFQPVTYVPLGLDATIKYGKKDLRVKNPHPCSLRIEIHATDSSLMVRITAEQKLKFRYEIYTEEDELTVPVTEDADRIRQGISVHVYRKRYQGEKLIDNALLYKDYYPPVYIR